MILGDNKATATSKNFSWVGLLVTLGIVYGDIGTSPLYVMKAILNAHTRVDAQYVIGAVSCVIWTLTLQTTFKYVLLALRADNNGEGGILALYALIRKHQKHWIYLLAIVGASTLVADGVITPAITVLSAIEGLHLYTPHAPILPICVAIIALLFFIQQFGTELIGKFFGPLMFLWFSLLGLLGVANIGSHLDILLAFNPYYAIKLLLQSPEWFLILGAVFLCTTGAEALYSDLGHCGIKNIRISWIFVKVMLILNYLGQGAWLLSNTNNLVAGINPFFGMMPRGMLFLGVIMATIAAIIASQALISGSFTIFSEAMNLKFWPRQKIKYPTELKGQLYIPFVNMLLFVLCILVLLFFKTSTNMEAAYGLSITITMLMTTFLLGFFLRQKQFYWWVIIPIITFFIVLESVFFVANLFKFFHGGWVTMLLAGIIFVIMYVWYNTSRIRNSHVKILDVRKYYEIISDIKSDSTIPKFASNVIYMSKLSGQYDVEQKIIYSIINKHPMHADHYWLLHVEYQDTPRALEYEFIPLIPDTLYRVNIKLGFREQPKVSAYFRQVIEDLVTSGEYQLTSCYPSLQKHQVAGNFIFVVINRIFTNLNVFSWHERLIMSIYHGVSHLKQNIPEALGMDTSNVLIEKVPLVVKPAKNSELRRVHREQEK